MKAMTPILVATALAAILGTTAADAQQRSFTGRLDISLVIANGCLTTIGGDTGTLGLDFGVQTSLKSDVDLSTQGANVITVNCSAGLLYTVSLDAGRNSTDINKRLLKSFATEQTVLYQLYQDPSRETVWGDVAHNNALTNIADGTDQKYPVYGRIAGGQATPHDGRYIDSVNVTVAY